MLAFLPFSGLWVGYRRHRRGLSSLAGIALASLVFFVCLSPWLVRNYQTFGRFVFIRDDFGLQFRLGNGPYADGLLMPYLQPNLNIVELGEFKRLGEMAYAKRCQRLAFDWIRENPRRFAVISVKRFIYYWGGVPKATNSTTPVDFRNSLFLTSSALTIWGLGRARKSCRVRGCFCGWCCRTLRSITSSFPMPATVIRLSRSC
jgi:hypothetical protein